MADPTSFLNGRVQLFAGDCLTVMAELPDDSVDSVVTDPPYHLHSITKRFAKTGRTDKTRTSSGPHQRTARGFMNKQWDGGDIAFRPETWAEVLRVMKPGAYLLAFSSSRTFGRMSVAIEDAGFITHPFIAWIFGSGFPKAHKVNAEGWEGWRYGAQSLKPAIEPIYLGQKPFSEDTGTANIIRHGTGALNIDGCRVDVTGQRPYEVRSWEPDQLLCDSCAALVGPNEKPSTPATKESTATKPAEPTSSAREKISQPDTDKTDIGCSAGTKTDATSTSSSTSKSGKTPTDRSRPDLKFTTATKTVDTTTSAICKSCRKPIIGGYIAGNGRDGEPSASKRYANSGSTNFAATPGPRGGSPSGRWPANVITDGSEEVIGMFPDAPGQQADASSTAASRRTQNVYGAMKRGNGEASAERTYESNGATNFAMKPGTRRGDEGSAARFFYSAKADADDRLGSKHPTVKPIDLMRYLCRLITPPGGTILDPFAGTGTTGEAAFYEGFNAILIEQEAEYQADIARRMKLVLSGPDERQRESIKAKNLPVNAGPLFGGQ